MIWMDTVSVVVSYSFKDFRTSIIWIGAQQIENATTCERSRKKSKSSGFFLFAVRISLKRQKLRFVRAAHGTWMAASLFFFGEHVPSSSIQELTDQRTFPTRLRRSLTSSSRRNAEGYDSINNITEGISALFGNHQQQLQEAYRLINFMKKLTTKTTIRVTLFLPFLRARRRGRERKGRMFIV